MTKYNVGDVIKLRDDLEDGEQYGSSDYLEEMGIMKNKPITILKIPKLFKDCYEVVDETGENWFLSDEMIEGLWEECKEKQDKLKLIDVLNMIAKGELKEGTKVKYKGAEFIYEDNELYDDDGDNICCYMCDRFDLTIEVELIEPDHFTDDGKMAEPAKIEELKELDMDFSEIDFQSHEEYARCAIQVLARHMIKQIDKLNEVIRAINKE